MAGGWELSVRENKVERFKIRSESWEKGWVLLINARRGAKRFLGRFLLFLPRAILSPKRAICYPHAPSLSAPTL